MPAKYLHVLRSPQMGPTCGYWDPSIAWMHARTMLGIEVAQVEIRERLPDFVRDDLESDFDGDDDTPRIVEVDVAEIDDGDER